MHKLLIRERKIAEKKKWIAGAIKKPGALTAQAKKAGKSVSEFIKSPGKNPSSTTKKRVALAKTLATLRGKKK